MCGRAAAAASLLTVTRTSSEPARASAATCSMVPGISAVSVLVMDWTAIGASLPIRPPPTLAVWVFLRRKIAMEVLVYHWECGFGVFAARGTAKPTSNHEKDHEQNHAGG